MSMRNGLTRRLAAVRADVEARHPWIIGPDPLAENADQIIRLLSLTSGHFKRRWDMTLRYDEQVPWAGWGGVFDSKHELELFDGLLRKRVGAKRTIWIAVGLPLPKVPCVSVSLRSVAAAAQHLEVRFVVRPPQRPREDVVDVEGATPSSTAAGASGS